MVRPCAQRYSMAGISRLQFTVEANISLPTATFALAGTVAKTSALFLRRGPSERSTVFLARAEHVGYLKKGGASALDPAGSDMPVIGACAAVLAKDDRNLSTTFFSERPLVTTVVRSDLVSLDPNRLDPAAIAARDELRGLEGPTLGSLIAPTRRRRTQSLRDAPFVPVLHVDDLSSVDWIEAEGYRPTTPGIIASAPAGNIFVSLLNPSKMPGQRSFPIGIDPSAQAEFGVFSTTRIPREFSRFSRTLEFDHSLLRLGEVPLRRGGGSHHMTSVNYSFTTYRFRVDRSPRRKGETSRWTNLITEASTG